MIMALDVEWPGSKRRRISKEVVAVTSDPIYLLEKISLDLAQASALLKTEIAIGDRNLTNTMAAMRSAVAVFNSAVFELSAAVDIANDYPNVRNRTQGIRRRIKSLFSHTPTVDDKFIQAIQSSAALEEECKHQIRDLMEAIDQWQNHNLPVDSSQLDETKFGKATEDGRAQFARKIFVESGWKPSKPLSSTIPKIRDSGIRAVADRLIMFEAIENEITMDGLEEAASQSPGFPDRFEEISAEHAIVGFEDLDTSYDPSSNRAHHPGEFDFGTGGFPTPPRHPNVPPVKPVQHEQGRVIIDVSR